MITAPLLAIGLATSQVKIESIESFRHLAANATGIESAASGRLYRGTENVHGTEHPFELRISSDYRFVTKANGVMREDFGFDGKTGWQLNASGVAHQVSHSDLDLTRLDYYIISGAWSAKNSPVEITDLHSNVAKVRIRGTATMATLTVDEKSHLPTSLSYWGPSGSQTWTYSNYKKLGGVTVPSRSELNSGENHDSIIISEGSDSKIDDSEFSMPKVQDDAFSYDLTASPNIEIKRLFGYVFVHPLLDGKDEGWFFLDTGAEVMVLDTEVAKAHNLPIVGHESVAGVVGNVQSDFYQGMEFKLGPATLKKPVYMSLAMGEFSKALGIKLAGICGYDFISRLTIDIDPSKTTLGLHPSGTLSIPASAAWTPFLFHGSVPAVICEYEGKRSGIFSLDTGSSSTVDFYAPTVTQNNLLKDRKVTSSYTGGAGGSTESKAGKIEYFMLGSNRFDNPPAVFQITSKGEFASPYQSGNIGMGFMGEFRIVWDYANSRVAFIKNPG